MLTWDNTHARVAGVQPPSFSSAFGKAASFFLLVRVCGLYPLPNRVYENGVFASAHEVAFETGRVLLDAHLGAHVGRRSPKRETAALESLAVMGEEVEVGGFAVVEIETSQSGATSEEEAALVFEEREKQVSLEPGQPIGR